MPRGPPWRIEDDFFLLLEIMGISGVKAGKATFEEVSKRLPGERTIKAIDHRWQYLNSKYKNGKLNNKAASSPPSVTTMQKTPKARSSPLKGKGKGKRVALSHTTTPYASPEPSDDGLAIKEVSLSSQRSSIRKAAKRNYAAFDVSESDGVDDDGTGEIAFEDVQIKTE